MLLYRIIYILWRKHSLARRNFNEGGPLAGRNINKPNKSASNMKTKYALTLSTIAALAMLALAGGKEPEQKTDTAKKQYTCEMHPEVVSDHPGKCPKCNMELTEKK